MSYAIKQGMFTCCDTYSYGSDVRNLDINLKFKNVFLLRIFYKEIKACER